MVCESLLSPRKILERFDPQEGTQVAMFRSDPAKIRWQSLHQVLRFTQDRMPIGQRSFDPHVGYAYRQDEPVWVVQLDLGDGSPRVIVGVLSEEEVHSDLEDLWRKLKQNPWL